MGLLAIISLIVSMMLHALAQLKILNVKLRNLRETATDNVDRKLRVTDATTVQMLDLESVVETVASEESHKPRDVSTDSTEKYEMEQRLSLSATNAKQIVDSVGRERSTMLLTQAKKQLVDVEMENLLRNYVEIHSDIIK